MKHIYHIFPFILFSGLLLNGSLQAAPTAPSMNELQPPTPPSQRSERPEGKAGGKPPADAIKMCLGKAEKTSCSMNGPRGEEKGFCEHTPDKLYFACNPKRDPQKGPQPTPRNDQTGQGSTLGLPDSQVTHFPINRESSHLKSQ